MISTPVSIVSLASISALGSESDAIWQNYLSDSHKLSEIKFKQSSAIVGKFAKSELDLIQQIKKSNKLYKNLDPTVLYALHCAQLAWEQSQWQDRQNIGINIGSSRGATSLFEKHHHSFLNKQKSPTLSSPTTTLGNISSWVAHHLNSQGPNISHSITCSTSLHSVLNAVAWIGSGLCQRFIVGGSEAALTEFTIAQMQALGIYAKNKGAYPNRALDLTKEKNGMVLGEAAVVACLQSGIDDKAQAIISGIGYATEILGNNTSLSTEAKCLQKSMQMAISNINPKDVDIVISHTPGTILGDQAEITAIATVFGENQPAITTNKWKLGHTLATSGLLSVELACLMIKHQKFIKVPYLESQKQPKQIKNILVNSVGFGGNAVSLLISSPENYKD